MHKPFDLYLQSRCLVSTGATGELLGNWRREVAGAVSQGVRHAENNLSVPYAFLAADPIARSLVRS